MQALSIAILLLGGYWRGDAVGIKISLLAATCQQPGQPTEKLSAMTPQAREHIRRAAASVGLILVRRVSDSPTQNPRPRGSAVIIHKEGIVVTNYHVIAEDKLGRLYDDIYISLPVDAGVSAKTSPPYLLKIVLVNKAHDLALLRIVSDGEGRAVASPDGFPAIEMGDSRAVRLLDDLIVIGFPEKGGETITVSAGLVEGTDMLDNWIKTNARLIHGNSGGAAVNSLGKLVGIPTKVIADRQPLDKDGDGFPDEYRIYGAVGFLRPAHLIEPMLAQLRNFEAKALSKGANASGEYDPPPFAPTPSVEVRGIIKSAADGAPVAGARVGLTPYGTLDVTATNLLTWGGSNGEGLFTLKKPVPPGRYTLKAKAINYKAFSLDVEISEKTKQLTVELLPSR